MFWSVTLFFVLFFDLTLFFDLPYFLTLFCWPAYPTHARFLLSGAK